MLSGSLRTEHRVILWTVLELVGGKSDYLFVSTLQTRYPYIQVLSQDK
jgi:hypothetical protein